MSVAPPGLALPSLTPRSPAIPMSPSPPLSSAAPSTTDTAYYGGEPAPFAELASPALRYILASTPPTEEELAARPWLHERFAEREVHRLSVASSDVSSLAMSDFSNASTPATRTRSHNATLERMRALLSLSGVPEEDEGEGSGEGVNGGVVAAEGGVVASLAPQLSSVSVEKGHGPAAAALGAIHEEGGSDGRDGGAGAEAAAVAMAAPSSDALGGDGSSSDGLGAPIEGLNSMLASIRARRYGA